MLFIDWIHSFETNNHIWDECGLFNPPGAIDSTENNEFDNGYFDIDTFFDEEH